MLNRVIAEFLHRLGYVHVMKRIREQRGKRLGDFGITLEQDYIGVLHGESSFNSSRRLLRLAALRQTYCRAGKFYRNARSLPISAFERLGLNLAILFEQYLHFAFSFFEFLAAGTRKLHSLFKQGQ